MIEATLYQTVYLLIVAVMTYFVMREYATIKYQLPNKNSKSHIGIALLVAVFMIFFFGLRPLHYIFGDMMNYYEDYNVLIKEQDYSFTWNATNYIFDNLLVGCGALGLPIDYFFFFIATIYFGAMLWACMKIYPNDTLLAFLVYLGAFSTYSYGVNGIKAGAAASIFLLAIAYRRNKVLAGAFLFLSLGFHHAMVVPIAAFLSTFIIKKRKVYLYAWIVSLIMAALHITFFQSLFAGFTDESGANYLSLSTNERIVSGFRPDFILYGAIPIFWGDYLIKKFHIKSDGYVFIWKVYVATNSVFLLCTYGSYINRIAYLSWLMYPIMLIYPFLKANIGMKRYHYLEYAVYGNIGFTIFMQAIYYA